MQKSEDKGDRMKTNKCYCVLLMTICLTLLSSCASPYLGRHVNIYKEGVCNFENFPASCVCSDKNFVFDYRIEKKGENGEYKISGTAQYVGGQTFTSFNGATLTLLLVHNKIVVETFVIAGGSGSLETGITFSRTFVYPYEFEASLMGYYMNTRG
jgi:hypothetical protein